MPAIGHSTNLIGSDSNIIIIRGGNDHRRPIYDQMIHAVEEFFPESGILSDQGIVQPESHSKSASAPSDNTPALRRVETGISSIVGSHNGDRPGGFVLVIDGSALGYVSLVHIVCAHTHSSSGPRRYKTQRSSPATCDPLRGCNMLSSLSTAKGIGRSVG